MSGTTALRARLLELLDGQATLSPESTVDRVLELIGTATPAEIIEEGTHLLGASFLWADTQGSKATEYMVRRITAADQVVRARLEKELAGLWAFKASVDAALNSGDGSYRP